MISPMHCDPIGSNKLALPKRSQIYPASKTCPSSKIQELQDLPIPEDSGLTPSLVSGIFPLRMDLFFLFPQIPNFPLPLVHPCAPSPGYWTLSPPADRVWHLPVAGQGNLWQTHPSTGFSTSSISHLFLERVVHLCHKIPHV